MQVVEAMDCAVSNAAEQRSALRGDSEKEFKGADWVAWPLSRSPASFHKFKDAAELRSFFRRWLPEGNASAQSNASECT